MGCAINGPVRAATASQMLCQCFPVGVVFTERMPGARRLHLIEQTKLHRTLLRGANASFQIDDRSQLSVEHQTPSFLHAPQWKGKFPVESFSRDEDVADFVIAVKKKIFLEKTFSKKRKKLTKGI
jgi:hypothetical protein